MAKSDRLLLRELREELRYHQTMNRVTARALLAGYRKCQKIGAKMRALQNPLMVTPQDEWRPEPFAENFEQKELL